jgi:RecB family endonuclease NucS
MDLFVSIEPDDILEGYLLVRHNVATATGTLDYLGIDQMDADLRGCVNRC